MQAFVAFDFGTSRLRDSGLRDGSHYFAAAQVVDRVLSAPLPPGKEPVRAGVAVEAVRRAVVIDGAVGVDRVGGQEDPSGAHDVQTTAKAAAEVLDAGVVI